MDHRVVILKGVGIQRHTARLPVRVDPLSQSEIGHDLTEGIYCRGCSDLASLGEAPRRYFSNKTHGVHLDEEMSKMRWPSRQLYESPLSYLVYVHFPQLSCPSSLFLLLPLLSILI